MTPRLGLSHHSSLLKFLHLIKLFFPLMQMCNIPYLDAQLDLLLTLRELPSSMMDLQPVSRLHLLTLRLNNVSAPCPPELNNQSKDTEGNTYANVFLNATTNVQICCGFRRKWKEHLGKTLKAFFFLSPLLFDFYIWSGEKSVFYSLCQVVKWCGRFFQRHFKIQLLI